MNKVSFKYIVIATMMFLLVGCNSTKSDAKKAASLINKSIEQTHLLKLDQAEKSFLKAHEIIDKYKENDKTEEFYEHFVVYRDKERKKNTK